MQKLPRDKIHAILKPRQGVFGIYIEDLDGGEVMELNSDHAFPSASLIKLPMLALLLRDAEQGRLDIHARRRIAKANFVGGFGALAQLPEDLSLSYFHLASLMITLSDNTATNEILDAIGVDRFNSFCQEMGWTKTSIARKMMDYAAIKAGRNNYTSSGEIGRMLSMIARGTLVSASASQTIMDMMALQKCRTKLPLMIPAVPTYAPEDEMRNIRPGQVLAANKTGDQYNLQHDVGIFTLPDRRRYVIAFLSEKLSDDYSGIEAAAKVSLSVYEALK